MMVRALIAISIVVLLLVVVLLVYLDRQQTRAERRRQRREEMRHEETMELFDDEGPVGDSIDRELERDTGRDRGGGR